MLSTTYNDLQGKASIRCFNCGHPGHLSGDCQKSSKEAKFSYCGRFGHKGFHHKNSSLAGKPKEVALSVMREPCSSAPVDVKVVEKCTVVDFEPFITRGMMKLINGVVPRRK